MKCRLRYRAQRANLSKFCNLWYTFVTSTLVDVSRCLGPWRRPPPPPAAHCLDIDATQPPDEHCCQMVDFKVICIVIFFLFPFVNLNIWKVSRFSNCFKCKNACFEVFFVEKLKVTLANFWSWHQCAGHHTQTSTKCILGSAFLNLDVTLMFRLLKDAIFSIDITGFWKIPPASTPVNV